MVIDSLSNTDVYAQKKEIAIITGSALMNSDGKLEVDSFGNSLISDCDTGDTSLGTLVKYTGEDSLMLYNLSTKQIQLACEGDSLNISVDYVNGTRYFLGAKVIKASKGKEGVFNIDLKGYQVFRVFMDGKRVKNYSYSNLELIILGENRFLVDNFSEVLVYVYKVNDTRPNVVIVTMDEKSEDTLFSLGMDSRNNEFEIMYKTYPLIYDEEKFHEDYFDNTFKGMTLSLFDSANVNQSVQKSIIRRPFRTKHKTVISSVENSLDINIFGAEGVEDLTHYVGDEDFRVIFNNPFTMRTTLINNCTIDNGVSISLEKEKNVRRMNISCGNYIDIQIINGIKSVINSDRGVKNDNH